jgi:hypothetical protein
MKMGRLGRLLSEHPHSVGETYGQHLVVASSFGLRMISGGIACLVHGLFPFLFCRTGSRTITELNEQIIMRRRGEHALSGAREAPLRS